MDSEGCQILISAVGDIITHGKNYEKTASFTESRYGEVMEEAMNIVGVYFPIYPVMGGAQILKRGNSFPRTYWEKYWIQRIWGGLRLPKRIIEWPGKRAGFACIAIGKTDGSFQSCLAYSTRAKKGMV